MNSPFPVYQYRHLSVRHPYGVSSCPLDALRDDRHSSRWSAVFGFILSLYVLISRFCCAMFFFASVFVLLVPAVSFSSSVGRRFLSVAAAAAARCCCCPHVAHSIVA